MNKNIKLILLSGTATMITFGCMKSHSDGKLSTAQAAAVAELNGDYQNARLYNDSLISAVNNANSTEVHYFDSKYHYYASRFDSCHSQYEHNLVSADHSHSSVGRVEMHSAGSGMMGQCQCCANGGHKGDIHQQMEELYDVHSHYHPH